MNISTSASIAAAMAVAFLLGREQVWALFGPADLGPVAFEQLERRPTPNDALACPPNMCTAKVDIVPPVYAVNVGGLRAAFAKVVASEPRVMRAGGNESEPSERYIQRSWILRFPDTINVRYFERPEGHSTIALYSRSQLGKGDFGVNKARIERWLEKLSAEVPTEK